MKEEENIAARKKINTKKGWKEHWVGLYSRKCFKKSSYDGKEEENKFNFDHLNEINS